MRRNLISILAAVVCASGQSAPLNNPLPVSSTVTSMEAHHNEIWAYYKFPVANSDGQTGKVEQVTFDGRPKLRMLDSLLSPSRSRYFFVEPLSVYLQRQSDTTPFYDDLDFESSINQPIKYRRPFYHKVLWDDNVPGMRVHVYRLSGERVKTVDLPRSYCGDYGTGYWVGNTWIALHERSGHIGGNRYCVFVNGVTGDIRLVGLRIGGEKSTPGGQYLTFTYQGVYFVNFRPVYPVRGDPLPDFGKQDEWESYKDKYYVRREKRPWDRLGDNDLRVLEHDILPDKKTAVLFAGRLDARVEMVEKDGYRHFEARGTHVILLNLEQSEKAATPSDYTQTTDLPRPAIRLQRDNKAAEFRIADDKGRIVWRKPFSDKSTR